MNNQRIARGLAMLAMLGLCATTAWAGFDDSDGRVQKLNAQPSPSATGSKVDNYLFQDEQLNLGPNDGIVRVLRTNQKILVNDFITAVIPLHHATPREIRGPMRLVTGLEGGRAEIIQDKNTHENYLEVIAPKFMIPYLRESVAALDVPWLKEYWDGAADLYYQLQNRGDATFADSIAATYAGDDGFSTTDPDNNAVRRYDEVYRLAEYQRAMKAIDIPSNEVMLDVKIYEIAGRDDTKLGTDYVAWKNGPGRNLFAFADAGYTATQRAGGRTSIFDPFLASQYLGGSAGTHEVLDTTARETYYALNYLLPSNFVDFLNAKGKAQVVSSQSILVESSKPAKLYSQQQVLAFVSNQATGSTPGGGSYNYDSASGAAISTSNGSGNPATADYARRLNYESAGTVGMSLSVTPWVGLESMELDLSLCVNEENGVSANKLPIINTRHLNTTVRLLDGQPFVLAGLSTKTNVESKSGAPWLSEIPILGYAFGGESNLKRDTDMVITITPHFYLSSQSKVAKSPRMDTMNLIVNGDTPLGLPDYKFGYDQWLFDPDTTQASPKM